MHKAVHIRVSLLILITLLLSSCAIHDKFPYICLRWGCFAKQVGLPDKKVVMKRMQTNAKVRKKKREAKKRKRNKMNETAVVNAKSNNDSSNEQDEPIESAKTDSTKYTPNPNGDSNYLILVFNEAHPPGEDSLLIKYPEKDFSEYEKVQIRNYVESLNFGKGDSFIVKEFKEYSQPELKGNTKAKEKLIEILKSLGINPKQIRFKD
ncbi:MAG: hypothetical protein J0L69_08630 [Bacteroidetes bacterium]|nr:hypothetical protein [Bacteroidota bacterium]